MQLIYEGNTKRCLPDFDFPRNFNVTLTKTIGLTWRKLLRILEKSFFHTYRKPKINITPKTECLYLLWKLLKVKITRFLKSCLQKSFCEVLIVPHNITNKFQPLDISVNKVAKSFISEKYNTWMINELSNQLKRGISSCDVKMALQLGIIEPLYAKWIVELYTHMQNKQEKIINSFKSAGITEAIQSAGLVLERIENAFHA